MMIGDCCVDYSFMYEFVVREAYDFLAPQLVSQGISVEEYVKKLVSIGTIAYEVDDVNRMCAFVVGYTHNTPDERSYITQVFVGPQHRRQGLCGKLLKEYISFCKQIGLKGIWLTTGEDNYSALKAYQENGFIHTGFYERRDRFLLELTI